MDRLERMRAAGFMTPASSQAPPPSAAAGTVHRFAGAGRRRAARVVDARIVRVYTAPASAGTSFPAGP